jgi:hypothetical protein
MALLTDTCRSTQEGLFLYVHPGVKVKVIVAATGCLQRSILSLFLICVVCVPLRYVRGTATDFECTQ